MVCSQCPNRAVAAVMVRGLSARGPVPAGYCRACFAARYGRQPKPGEIVKRPGTPPIVNADRVSVIARAAGGGKVPPRPKYPAGTVTA